MWAGGRRAKRGVTSAPGVAGLCSLPAVGRPHGVASTQGTAPPCEVVKQTCSLSASRDREKAEESTFHALSKRLGDAGLKTSWDSDCGRDTVVKRGSWAALCAQRGEKTHPTPTRLRIWVLFNLQNRNLEFQKISALCFPVRFLQCHRFAHALCRRGAAAPGHARPPEEQPKARLLRWAFLTLTCLICCQSNLVLPYSSAVGSGVALQVNCTVCTQAHYL